MERRDSSKAETPPTRRSEDKRLDEALEATFPASDPPAMTHPHRPHRKADASQSGKPH